MPEKKKKGKKAKVETKKLSLEEFEKKVVEHAKKGLTAERIGETLRGEGIHPKEYKKKISVILKEKNLYKVPEAVNVEKKLEGIKKHYDKNKQDKRAMRDRERIFSALRKIKRYHNLN